MGKRNKKSLQQRLCEFTYRKKGFHRRISCIQKSMKEVCDILNSDACHRSE